MRRRNTVRDKIENMNGQKTKLRQTLLIMMSKQINKQTDSQVS